MEKIIGIYKITSPTGSIYIGQSRDVLRRKSEYAKGRLKHQTRLQNSVKKHGWDSHIFEIICRCSIEELNDLEIFYIQLFDTFNTKDGLNLTSGGKAKTLISEETRIKLKQNHSRHNLGKKASLETREKIRQARLRQPDPNLGKKRTGKALQNIIDTRVPISKEHREKMINGLLKSEKVKAHNNSEENINHLKRVRQNYTYTEEHREKLKKAWVIRKANMTPSQRAAFSKGGKKGCFNRYNKNSSKQLTLW